MTDPGDTRQLSAPPRMFQEGFRLPEGAAELVVVRHAAPEPEVEGRPFPLLYGRHGNPPLSERGWRQANAVARRLAFEDFSGIYVTPLRRTQETAEPVAAMLGLRPVVVEELRETGLGELEAGEFDRRAQLGDPLVGRIFAAQRWDVIPGAEDSAEFAERVRRGLEFLGSNMVSGRSALAYLHGGVLAEICRQVTGSQPFAFLFAENASITRLVKLSDGRWRLRSFNDVAHLEDEAH